MLGILLDTTILGKVMMVDVARSFCARLDLLGLGISVLVDPLMVDMLIN